MSLEIVTFPSGPIETNAYLVADTETGDALIIDAPADVTTDIVAEADRRGWRIGQIVITHTHWDHVADAKALTEATEAPLAAHPLAEAPLANPTPLVGELPVEVPPVATNQALEDGDTVTLGGYTFQVMHLPGHDPAHIALLDAEHGVLLSGDVLFPNGHGRTDIPGTDQADMNRSLHRIVAEAPANTVVYPGHGAPTTVGAETRWIAAIPQE
jgi:hydroxyacylglutathione hydrolase